MKDVYKELNKSFEKILERSEVVKKENVDMMATKDLGDPYDFYKNPLQKHSWLKTQAQKIKKFTDEWRKAGKSDFYISQHTKRYEDFMRCIQYADDIVPKLKQLSKGKSVDDVKKILQSSVFWDWDDRDYFNDLAKVRGPLDLYIMFTKDGKLDRWYF